MSVEDRADRHLHIRHHPSRIAPTAPCTSAIVIERVQSSPLVAVVMPERQVKTDTGSAPTDIVASSAAGAVHVGLDLRGNIGQVEGARSMNAAQNSGGSTSVRGVKDATHIDLRDTEMVDAPAIQSDEEDEMDVDQEDCPMVDAF